MKHIYASLAQIKHIYASLAQMKHICASLSGVYVESGNITRVEPASGKHDFAAANETYIEP